MDFESALGHIPLSTCKGSDVCQVPKLKATLHKNKVIKKQGDKTCQHWRLDILETLTAMTEMTEMVCIKFTSPPGYNQKSLQLGTSKANTS